MKKVLYLFIVIFVTMGIASCSKSEDKQQEKWEYKTLIAWSEPSNYFSHSSIPVPGEELNKLGEEGWELVSVYTRIQTVHPNFGNDKYVTGLQPNTRTHGVFYVFKRPKQDNDSSSDEKNSKYVIIAGRDEAQPTEIAEDVTVVDAVPSDD